jgi:hypothetical protein
MNCDFTKLTDREVEDPSALFSVVVLIIPEKPWTDFSKPPPHEVIDFKAKDATDASNAIADLFQEQNDPNARKPKWWPHKLLEVTGNDYKDCTPTLSDVFYDREIIKLIPVKRSEDDDR